MAVFGKVGGKTTWYIDEYESGYNSADKKWDKHIQKTDYGSEWTPASRDYDGDGSLDLALFSNNTDSAVWLIDMKDDGFASNLDPQQDWNDTVVKNDYGGWADMTNEYDGDPGLDFTVVGESSNKLAIFMDRSGTSNSGNWDLSHLELGDNIDYQIVNADYDSDGKDDISIFDEYGNWLIDYAKNGLTYWDAKNKKDGYGHWTAVPGDYNGDTSIDLAVFDNATNATWFIDHFDDETGYNPSGSNWDKGISKSGYGSGWEVAPGDYDGDGRLDLAVFGSSSGNATWWIDRASDGFSTQPAGNWNMSISKSGYGNWQNVSGYFNDDKKMDLAVFSNSSGNAKWFVDHYEGGYNSAGHNWDKGISKSGYGSGWEPVVGHFDTDTLPDLAVYGNGSGNATWWIDRASDGLSTQPAGNWNTSTEITGLGGWLDASADFDGDGILDTAVFHPRDAVIKSIDFSSGLVATLSNEAPSSVETVSTDNGLHLKTIQQAYNFEGDVLDSTGNDWHGAAHGNPVYHYYGGVNKGIELDGYDDYVTFPSSNANNFDTDDDFSISLWARPSIIQPGTWRDVSLVEKGETPSKYPFAIRMFTDDHAKHGKIQAIRYDGTNVAYLESTTRFDDELIKHIVFTKNGETLNLYINGVLEDTTTDITSSTTQNDYPMIVGYRGDHKYEYKGTIDELKVYGYGMTQAEVLDEYDHDLTIYQPFDGYFFDRTQRRNNGTGFNGATFGDGVVGRALKLDGVNDYVSIPDAASANFGVHEDFAVSVWVKPELTQAESGLNTVTIVEKVDHGVAKYPFAIRYYTQKHTNHGKIQAVRYDGTNVPIIISNSRLNDGQFHHVVFTKDGSTLKLYIDGVLEGTTTDTISSNPKNNAPLFIGQRGNTNYTFEGMIDELKIFNRAFTDTDVIDEYNLDELVLDLDFDNSTRDESQYSDIATRIGGDYVTGASGQAIYLNGDGERLSIPYSDVLNIDHDDDFSVSVHVKPDITQHANTYNDVTIVERYSDATTPQYPFAIRMYTQHHAEEGKIQAVRHDGTHVALLTSTTRINDGNFHHIAFIKNGSNLELYIDGQLEDSIVDNTVYSTQSNRSLLIGQRANSKAYSYKGAIDELKVYNTAKSITELY